ncbi:hypothetical protein N8K70_16675 [Microbacterium betulae]|uniref:VOC domain-containing protein n=1 Tax=Microbacterium betulae TaxID=2981139 RepID=A0AA97I6D5_9MICO|nr:hypothetical protein [Microbacterium sp. AB]WOF23007.1 hypothetical protein N8K70_16675 [Microbacterium sp. AB]
MTVTIQQILFTAKTTEWHRLAGALGLTPPSEPTPEWAEFDGDGVLAIHHASGEHPAGQVDVHLLVDDLDAAERAASGFDVSRGALDGVGEILTVRAASGIAVTVSAGGRVTRPGELAVLPIWFQPDLDEPHRILEALGLRPRIVSDRGGWVELVAGGGGLVALHHGDEPLIGLSFLAPGDLDALAARLRDAGFDPAVIDESYGRTVRVPDPDRGDEVWINGAQDDLYGYSRVE